MIDPPAPAAVAPTPLQARRGFTFNTGDMQPLSFGPDCDAFTPLASPALLSSTRPPTRPHPTANVSHNSQSSGHSSLRPRLFRSTISEQMAVAPMASPEAGVNLDPARVDYFEQASATKKSMRPIVNLAAVMTGRVMLSLGLGGVSVGLVPIPPGANGLTRVAPPLGTFGGNSHVVLALSTTAATVGALTALGGLGAFCLDTYVLSPRRAAMMAAISTIGVLGVASGGIVYIYGQDSNDLTVRWLSILPRTVGNFGVFYALPNSFASSEIVHGNAPIPHREQTRHIASALGGAFMLLYGYISSPGLDAPQWAREIALAAGIVGICIGASMARTNNLRLASERRQLRSPGVERRSSSFFSTIPLRPI